jgi:hypothetical protein
MLMTDTLQARDDRKEHHGQSVCIRNFIASFLYNLAEYEPSSDSAPMRISLAALRRPRVSIEGTLDHACLASRTLKR